MRKIFFPVYFFFLASIFLLSGCDKEKSHHDEVIVMKVMADTSKQQLFYSGIIKPLDTSVITSPVDGTVIEKKFQYGERVKKSQLLFTINSGKFEADYKTALMQYIKSKSDFQTAQTQLSEAKFLHKNLLISDDDYKSKAASFYAAQLTLLQAKDVLEGLLKQLKMPGINLYQLSISDIDKITKALHFDAGTQVLRILAPADGFVYAASKSDEDAKKIHHGDSVKQGDPLVLIGDLNGLSVDIKVNELVVNQLKAEQPVKVTGIAFPAEILQGFISRIDRQGESSNGGMPTFNVRVSVDHLTPNQKKYISVGMSADVQISVDEGLKISIPLAAVKNEDGESFVNVRDKNNINSKRLVKTGKTTANKVALLHGLEIGESIVVPS